MDIPAGKPLHNYGKSPVGKLIISMAILHSCVKIPEGIAGQTMGFQANRRL